MMINALDAPRRQLPEIDYALLWSVLLLLFTGMVMVYSASIAIAEAGRTTGYQPTYYLWRHLAFLVISMMAAGIAFQIPLSLWQRYAPILFMIGVALLAIVLIPGIGRDVNGARRWLPLGIVNLQPSELMKLFAVLYTADYTVRKINVMHDLKQAFLP
ncbi:MAG: FtsW/RodA/SpoVE family cell cycle protein, partial [Azonexus sp.]